MRNGWYRRNEFFLPMFPTLLEAQPERIADAVATSVNRMPSQRAATFSA